MISAAIRDLPKGGVKSFRNATTAKDVVGVQIHFEAANVSAALAAGATVIFVTSAAVKTTNGSETYGTRFVHIPENSGKLVAAKESKAQITVGTEI
jgi:hypothetical protein